MTLTGIYRIPMRIFFWTNQSRHLADIALMLLVACNVVAEPKDGGASDAQVDTKDTQAPQLDALLDDVAMDGVGVDASPDADPTVRRVYGTPWAADGLANLEVGSSKNRTVNYRIRAEHTGQVDRATVFFVFREGYGAGDGGDIRIEIRQDDASPEHLPSDIVLASALVTEPMSENYPQVTFEPPATLEAGRLYHIQFSNVAADSAANYVSTDELFTPAASPQQPTVSDETLACLYSDDDGATWTHNRTHTPIYSLRYMNGASQGVGYTNARSESGVRSIGAGNKVRVAFTVTGGNRTVTEMNLRLEGAGFLKVRLETANGALIEEGTLERTTAARDWSAFGFAAPQELQDGESYHLEFSSDTDSFTTFGLSDYGGRRGAFDVGSTFGDGELQFTTGGDWESDGTDAQCYFRTL